MTIDSLEKELKQQKIDAIYMLYGEETYILETIVKKIKKIFGELILGINYITIDENNVKNFISDIETPAFGYERKLIIVKNSGLLKKEGKKKNIEISNLRDKVNEYIKENIDVIKQNTVLIFIEEDIGKYELAKTLEEKGIVCNFEKMKPNEIIKRLKSICNGYKVNVDDKTLQLLIETCGLSMSNLINEIRKLIEYVGKDGTITQKEIELLSIKEFDSIIFDLTDSLGKKDTQKALNTLKELLYNKEPIQKILITLYNHFKKLYIVKLSERYNKKVNESLNLKANQMFLVSKYKKQAEYFKEKELRQILQELINLDENYKMGKIDINIGLESILCTYC